MVMTNGGQRITLNYLLAMWLTQHLYICYIIMLTITSANVTTTSTTAITFIIILLLATLILMQFLFNIAQHNRHPSWYRWCWNHTNSNYLLASLLGLRTSWLYCWRFAVFWPTSALFANYIRVSALFHSLPLSTHAFLMIMMNVEVDECEYGALNVLRHWIFVLVQIDEIRSRQMYLFVCVCVCVRFWYWWL